MSLFIQTLPPSISDIPADVLCKVELERINDKVYEATTGVVRAITSMTHAIQQGAVTERYVDLVKASEVFTQMILPQCICTMITEKLVISVYA